MIVHQLVRRFPELVTCGIRRTQGMDVTSSTKRVTCPACKAHVRAVQAAAKARFADVLAVLAK